MDPYNTKRPGGMFRSWIFKSVALPLGLFAIVLALVAYGLNVTSGQKSAEELKLAEDNLRKAVVSCYAIEGRYPDSYEYIKEHYGVMVDEERYIVHYQVFASNIMPDITLVERGAGA